MKRTVRFVLLFAALCLAACSSKMRAPTEYEDTAAGFDAFAHDLIAAVSDDRQSDYEVLAKSLTLPDPASYFARTFGPEAGARLASEYDGYGLVAFGRQSWDGLRTLVVDEGRTNLQTERHDRADDEQATGFQAIALRSTKEPLALYNIRLTRPDGSKSFTLWSFVHVGGQFRLVGHMKKVRESEPGGEFERELDLLGELPVVEARRLMHAESEKAEARVSAPSASASASASSAANVAAPARAGAPQAAPVATQQLGGGAAPARPQPKPATTAAASGQPQKAQPISDEDRYVFTIQ